MDRVNTASEGQAPALTTMRSLQHRLGNQLALAVGYAELIAINSELPEEARAQAAEALRGAEEAVETLAALRRLTERWTPEEVPPVAGAGFGLLVAGSLS
jgi:two-component sensor histidine kinase